MSNIRIKHDRQNPYVMLNSKSLASHNLSWGAKGLWAYLLSLPDDWQVSVAHLSTIYNEKGGGEKAIRALLAELIEANYCRFTQEREGGKYTSGDYEIYEHPSLFKEISPHCPQGDAVQADAVHAPLLSIKGTKQEENNKHRVAVPSKKSIEYKCLEPLPLSPQEKETLTNTFPEPVVEISVKWVGDGSKVKTTLIAALLWACKNQDKINDVPQGKESNKEWCSGFQKESSSWVARCTHEAFEVYPLFGMMEGYKIRYTELGFKTQVENALRKANLWVPL